MISRMRLKWSFALAILATIMSLQLVSSQWSDAELTKQYVKARQAWLNELRNTLEHAEMFTLFSLDPDRDVQAKPKEEFKGYRQLGKTQVPAGSDRTNLLAVLYDGIANGNAIAQCFNPRHGIRATQGSNTVELLICFECGQIYTFSNRGSNQMFATSAKPAAAFNSYLKKAKVSLSKDKTRKPEPSRFE